MAASKEELDSFVIAHAKLLHDVIVSANKEQNGALSPQARAKAQKRTISSLMNDLVNHNLEQLFGGKHGIQVGHHYNQISIIFSPNIIMRCKKAEHGKVSVNNTQLMFNFMHQLPSMLPGMPDPATNIMLIYEWDKTRTTLTKIAVQYPIDKASCLYEVPIPIETAPETLLQTETEEIKGLPTETKQIKPKAKRVKKSKRVNKNEQGKETKP